MDDWYWIRLPLFVLRDTRLTKTAVLVLAALIDQADERGAVKNCTITRLAKVCGVSEKTVRRSEAALCDAGYIRITERTGRASLIWVALTAGDYSAIHSEYGRRDAT